MAHSSAQKLLVAEYRAVLCRLAEARQQAERPLIMLLRLPFALHVEELESRFMYSATPVGTESLINTTTTDTQQTPAVVADLSGETIAVWASHGQDGSGWGIYGRKFDANGNPITNEFLVNQTVSGDQTQPTIAIDGDGNFTVAWTSNQGGTPAVYARLFNADTTPATGEITVASSLNGDQDPSVGMDSSGDFVVAYDGGGPGATQGIFSQRYSTGAIAIGAPTLVNNASASPQLSPSIAIDPQGDYTIAWTDTTGSFSQIKAQRFAANGTGSGQFLVGTGGFDSESQAHVGMDDGGNTVIVWSSNFASSGTWDIYSRRYDHSGNALTVNPVAIATATTPQLGPSVAVRYDGHYAVSWTNQSQDGSSSQIQSQLYNPDGSQDGTQFQVNTTTAGLRGDSSIAWNGSAAAVVWDGNSVADVAGVSGQLYTTETQANRAPIIAVPPVQTVSETGSLAFSSLNGNAISIVDPDGGGAFEQVTLTAANGTISIGSTSGLNFTTGTGVLDTTEVFSGSLADINAALQTLTFAPAQNPNPNASIQISVNDLGNTGPGGARTSTATAVIAVSPVAHTPSITNASTALGVQTNNGLVVTRNPVDGPAVGWFKIGNVSGGTVYLSDGTTAVNGFITYAQANAGLKFTPSNNSTGGSFTVQAATAPSDDSRSGDPVIATIYVYGPPAITAPGNQSASENTPLVFNSANNNVISINDPLASTVGGTDTVTLATTNATFTLGTSAGLVFSGGASSGSSAVTFTGSIASINNALSGLQLIPTQNFFGTTAVQMTVSNPGTSFTNGPLSSSAAINVTVHQVNIAPSVTGPAPQSVAMNTPLVFSTANSNALTINDPDNSGQNEQLTIVASGGTVTLGSQVGLSFPPNGHGPSAWICNGTLANLRAALSGLTFTPTASYTGSASLQVTLNDQGHAVGPSLSASVTIPMTVATLNQAPVINIPVSQTVNQSPPLVYSTATSNPIWISNIGNTGGPEQVTLKTNKGTVSLATTNGLTLIQGTGVHDGTVTLNGTLAAINAALNGLSYSPTINYTGLDSISISVSDLGHTVSGITQIATGTANITVSDAPPTVVIPASASPGVVSGTSTNLSVVADDDGGESSLTYTWSTTGSSPSGVTFGVNNKNSAKNTVATFHQAGTYTFLCTITDAGSVSTTSTVTVVVNQTLSSIKVSPNNPNVEVDAQQQFSAIAYDQFNQSLSHQPQFTWAVTAGVGSFDGAAKYTAPGVAGAATIAAISGSVSGTASVTIKDQAPQVSQQASASPTTVSANSSNLKVTATDDGGSSNLTYTWSVQSLPNGAPAPTFSANANNASSSTTAFFYAAGQYTLRVTITDADGQSTTSSVSVTVSQTPTTVVVTPSNPTIPAGGTQQFTATVLDQFGSVLTQNQTITWSAGGGGGSFSTNTAGLYTAPTSPGTYNISANDGGLQGSTTVSVVQVSAVASPNPVTGTTTTLAATNSSVSGLKYLWSATTVPLGATTPIFSINNSTAAQSTVATFFQAGNYTFQVAMVGTTTTYETVQVTVNQTLTSLTVTPSTSSLNQNGTVQLSAAGKDQFGKVMVTAPQVTWGVSSGGGSINNIGKYTAPNAATTATITAVANTAPISGSATVTVTNAAPVITTAASVNNGNTVTSASANLKVSATDDGGSSNLTYTWSLTGNPPAPVLFSANGTTSAANTTANFSAPGNYHFLVTVTDASGLTTTSTVAATVTSTLATIVVSPGTPTVNTGGTITFTALTYDQFGAAINSPAMTWSANALGGGTFSGNTYHAPGGPTTDTVTATPTNGGPHGSTQVNVVHSPSAAATPFVVTANTTTLTALGAPNGSSYSWSVTSAPNGAPTPTFSVNNSTSAQSPVATFYQAGNYTFQVAITNGTTTFETVQVNVNQTLTSISVTPSSASLNFSGTTQFAALGVDQFGNSMTASQLTWGVTSGGGSIGNNGRYTAPTAATTASITAIANDPSITNSATVTVTNSAPVITAAASVQGGTTVTGTSASLSVAASDDGGSSNLTYTWSLTGNVPAPVLFSVNGTTSAASTTANFSQAGTYNFLVTVKDSGGLTTTSSVTVTVTQTLSTIVVLPASPTVSTSGTLQFSATGYDQFGAALLSQPTFNWSVGGNNGQVASSGLYTAPSNAGNYTITAASGQINGSSVTSVIAITAGATPNPVNGTTATLTAVPTVGSGLAYAWSATAIPTGAPSPTFTSPTATSTGVTFYEAGTYIFQLAITGATATYETVSVQVNQTLTSIAVFPATGTNLNENDTQTFSAVGYDQFGSPMSHQPSFNWSVKSGGGTINGQAQYTAPATPTTSVISASSGTVSATATVSVSNGLPTIVHPASAGGAPTAGGNVNLSVLGADDGGASNLIYTWTLAGTPPGPVAFSENGTNAAQQTTASFTQPGTYNFLVTITDAGGLSTTSSLAIVVQPNNNLAPVLSTPDAQATGENSPLAFSIPGGNAISINNPGNAREQVTLTATGGTLTLASTNNISGGGGFTGINTASMTFQGFPADVNAALNGLTFTPSLNFYGFAGIQIQAQIGGGQTSAANIQITIVPVAHPPSVSNASTATNHQTTSGLVVTSNPSDGTAQGYYQVNSILNGTLYLNDGITPLQNGQFITYPQGAAGLKFTPALNSSTDGSFTVQAATVPNSSGLVATAVTAHIFLDGPVNNVPGPQAVAKNITLTFSPAGSNAISVSDAHAGTTTAINVLLSGSDGTITLASLSGLTVVSGGNGQSSIGVSGTVAAINAALNGLTFTPTTGFNGIGGITLTTTDSQLQVSAVSAVPITIGTPGPSVVTAAGSDSNPVNGISTDLSVLGDDADGEATLTYTWTVLGTPPGAVTFSDSGTNSAKDTTATFTAAGNYLFQVLITDSTGLTATSSVAISVDQSIQSIVITPGSANLNSGGSQAFTASALDQFGQAISAPPTFTWSLVSGTGSIDSSGLYTAAATSGNVTISASVNGISNSASITVVNAAPTVATPAAASVDPLTGKTATLSALGSDDGGESNLTYTWSVVAVPAGASNPTFDINGTNSAKAAIATFNAAGTYGLRVTIADAGGLSVTSDVTVIVAQVQSSIVVSPANSTLLINSFQSFSATAYDQFGAAMVSQPVFDWGATAGTISTAGDYTAPGVVGNVVITATGGLLSGSTNATIVGLGAAATPNPVTGTTTTLTEFGASPALTFTWSATSIPSGAATPTFSVNGSSAAQSTVATFFAPGDYVFKVDMSDATSSTVAVTVDQSLHSISVSPTNASLNENDTQQFAASGYDQFGQPMFTPPTFTWSVINGLGSVNASGLYTAATLAGNATIKASASGVSDTASVAIINATPTVATPASATLDPSGTTASLNVLGSDDGGEANLTYTWSATSIPSGAASPTYSINGTNAAKAAIATFSSAGTYLLSVKITDSAGLSTTSNVTLVVAQIQSSIAVSPSNPTMLTSGVQSFTATAYDQFNAVMATQPTFNWNATAGVIDSNGLYTAAASGGSAVITATSGSIVGSTDVTIVDIGVAAATPNPVTGQSTTLAEVGPSAGLTFTWSATSIPSGAASPTYSVNGTNSAQSTQATFYAAGDYVFQVTISGSGGVSATSSVSVMVNQTLKSITVTPGSAAINENDTKQFTAAGYDQFGQPMSTPPTFTWSVINGLGSVNASGLYTAATLAGNATIKASASGVSDTASVAIINATPTVATPASATLDPSGTTASLNVLGSDDGGEANLTYTWSATSIPSGAASPTYSINGTNAAKAAIATFSSAGTYLLSVKITDSAGLSTTSNVTLVVAQIQSSIAVSPSNPTMLTSGVQSFTATAYDQFNAVMATQPTFNWNATAGVIDSNGSYTAAVNPGQATITASSAAISASASVTVTLPLSISAPTTQRAVENNTLVFSEANSNAIQISDPNTGSNTYSVTLSATAGTVTLGTKAGITIASSTGDGDAVLTFSGNLAAINAALDGLVFTPSSGFTGSASFQIQCTNTSYAPGGAATATSTVSMAVVPRGSVLVTHDGDLTTNVLGSTSQFSIVLTEAPIDVVTIHLTSSDPAAGTTDVSSVTFTPSNWNVPQTVTVTGHDDIADGGAVPYTIELQPATSSDPAFAGVIGDTVAMTNLGIPSGDDVPPPAAITPPPASDTSEPPLPEIVIVPPPQQAQTQTSDQRQSSSKGAGSTLGAPKSSGGESATPPPAAVAPPAPAAPQPPAPAAQPQQPPPPPPPPPVAESPILAPKAIGSAPPAPSAQLSAAAIAVANVKFLAEGGHFDGDLAKFQKGVEEQVKKASAAEQFATETVSMMSGGLAVGYVLWLIRGGYLISSLLSSMPAWRFVDPLPILNYMDEEPTEKSDDEDQSLEELLGKTRAHLNDREGFQVKL